jgi:hypothetical protein
MASELVHPTGKIDMLTPHGNHGRGPAEHVHDHAIRDAQSLANGHTPHARGWEEQKSKDILCPENTPVRAVFDGFIGKQFGFEKGHEHDRPSSDHHGQRLHLEKVGGGNEAYYQHLNSLAPGLAPGSFVQAGDIIGYSGIGGDVPHLHFALLHGDLTQALDHATLDPPSPPDSIFYTNPGLGDASPNTNLFVSQTPPSPPAEASNAFQTPPDANASVSDGTAIHQPPPTSHDAQPAPPSPDTTALQSGPDGPNHTGPDVTSAPLNPDSTALHQTPPHEPGVSADQSGPLNPDSTALHQSMPHVYDPEAAGVQPGPPHPDSSGTGGTGGDHQQTPAADPSTHATGNHQSDHSSGASQIHDSSASSC